MKKNTTFFYTSAKKKTQAVFSTIPQRDFYNVYKDL